MMRKGPPLGRYQRRERERTMANQQTWIGISQISIFNEETTSIWLRKALNDAGRDKAAYQNFIAYLCAVLIIYDTFRPDRTLQVVYYHEEVNAAYQQEEWTLTMMMYLPYLKRTFLPHQYAMVWREYYRKTRRRLLAKCAPSLERQLIFLDKLTMDMMEAGIGEKILGEMAQDASLAWVPG